MKSNKLILGLIMVLFMLFPFYFVRFIVYGDKIVGSICVSLIITGTLLIIIYGLQNQTIIDD